MLVLTLNVNGIRSASKRGLFEWLITQQADVICLQEIRAHEHLERDFADKLPGYQGYFFPAEKAGYSGVGIYSRHQPHHIHRGLGWEDADREGRYIQLDFSNVSVASLYMPSGSSGEHRQAIKFNFLEQFLTPLKNWLHDGKHYILCGDWNIAHKAIDLKNWRSNQKNAGFLPAERAWMDKIFDELGWVDAFRVINQEVDQYTWWSNRGQAWAKNVGWRIDYQIISPGLRDTVKTVDIYKAQRFSDHAPLIIDYEFDAFPSVDSMK
jgi:exodeoxyribonuclease III